MAFVKALCSKCDKEVEVDDVEEAWVCPHCSKPFVIEKGIRRYKSQHKAVIKKVRAVKKNPTDFEVKDSVLIKYKGDSAEVAIPEIGRASCRERV